MGMKLDQADVKLCGRAEKVIVNKDTTTIIGGIASEALQDRITALEGQIAGTTSEYMKMQLEDRLAQLTGGIGVIRVGAYTDSEFNAKKYKFENAINATQAALQEGILPGGGVACFTVKPTEPMFEEVMKAPMRRMAKNASVDIPSLEAGEGIDFKTKEIVNMFDAGIIDPFKVTRLALESAVAIATTLVSTETVIITKPDEKAG